MASDRAIDWKLTGFSLRRLATARRWITGPAGRLPYTPNLDLSYSPSVSRHPHDTPKG